MIYMRVCARARVYVQSEKSIILHWPACRWISYFDVTAVQLQNEDCYYSSSRLTCVCIPRLSGLIIKCHKVITLNQIYVGWNHTSIGITHNALHCLMWFTNIANENRSIITNKTRAAVALIIGKPSIRGFSCLDCPSYKGAMMPTRIHYSGVIIGAMTSQIASLTIVYSAVYSGADQIKTSKLCVTGLCEGNSPVTGEFPAQRSSNEENFSIWWLHHVYSIFTVNYQLIVSGMLHTLFSWSTHGGIHTGNAKSLLQKGRWTILAHCQPVWLC